MIEIGSGQIELLRGGDGPPLLFLHGAGGGGVWLPFHERMAATFTVLAPSHPGFGGSDDLPELADVHDLAFFYADLVETLDLGVPVVVGTSFGGWIAAELAAYVPDAASTLVLVDAIGLYIEGAPVADLFRMSPPQMMEALFADPAVAASLLPAEPDLDTIIGMARDEASFARFAWDPFCHDPKLPRLLPRTRASTLVIWGERDGVVSPVHGERYAELIPGARLEVIPGCGHAAAMERPDQVADQIFAFIDREGDAR